VLKNLRQKNRNEGGKRIFYRSAARAGCEINEGINNKRMLQNLKEERLSLKPADKRLKKKRPG